MIVPHLNEHREVQWQPPQDIRGRALCGEQAYFWRMLKLVGHKDVTLYEMQRQDDIGHLKQAK